MSNIIIGWNEWCSLPEIGIPAIKAKIDTGAKTSCLHAFNITEYYLNDQLFINFFVHPIQYNNNIALELNAPVTHQKNVSSSTGVKELRYFTQTTITIGGKNYKIDLNFTNRNNMMFKMLIGRKALKKRFIVDPSHKQLLGKLSQSEINKIYDIQSTN